MTRIKIDDATGPQLDWLVHQAKGLTLVRYQDELRRRLQQKEPGAEPVWLATCSNDWRWVARDGNLERLRQWHLDAGSMRLGWELHLDLIWVWSAQENKYCPVAEGHDLEYDERGEYIDGSDCRSTGDTAQIAVLRCWLKHKIGTEACVPSDV